IGRKCLLESGQFKNRQKMSIGVGSVQILLLSVYTMGCTESINEVCKDYAERTIKFRPHIHSDYEEAYTTCSNLPENVQLELYRLEKEDPESNWDNPLIYAD
uniref:hypothetical protein n=1 Tax=Vibrio astriarenae TaxID=1481923 RepID=UPI003736F665